MQEKICINCGATFLPNNNRQKYCKQQLIRICPICGKPYTYICDSKIPTTCNSSKCNAQNKALTYAEKSKSRICRVCGEEFIPRNPRQLDCNRTIIKHCSICGDAFEDICQINHKQTTCGKLECMDKQRILSTKTTLSETPRVCAWCKEEFIATHPSQIYCDREHYNDCRICGKRFKLPKIVQSVDIRQTCSKSCSDKLKLLEGNQNSPEARRKKEITCLTKYGCRYPSQNPEVKAKEKATFQKRTGYDHPFHDPTVRSKAAKSARKSTLESKVATLLDAYNIEYQTQYSIANYGHCHAFDFYIPQYKILIDADGVYYHAYLSDADGRHVRDDYDEVRIAMVPQDHMFFVVVEDQEERCIKQIVDFIKSKDAQVFQYDTDLFNWCREIGFPYPQYTDIRLHRDFTKLQNAVIHKYNPYSKIAESTIRHFHKSIYDAHVKGYVSPREAWEDDALLKKVITNRLIYKNDVDPSKILSGFNVSKLCPRVSMFNPLLGKYLTQKYLSAYDVIFDPFSGFSGRLLGVTSTGKRYVGSDMNTVAVNESNQIIDYLTLNAEISVRDIFDYPITEEYSALLTCPPYADKEIYSTESVFMSCDAWIDYILEHFKCKRYVFVVDTTETYKDFVVEEISTSSHFNTVKEKVIVITP